MTEREISLMGDDRIGERVADLGGLTSKRGPLPIFNPTCMNALADSPLQREEECALALEKYEFRHQEPGCGPAPCERTCQLSESQ